MNDQSTRRLDALKRVCNFAEAHAELFPQGTLARELLNVISDVTEKLGEYAATQVSGRGEARRATAAKDAARAAILEGLAVLRRTARSIAVVVPGVDDKFRIPRNLNDQLVLDTAHAFLAESEPLKDEFLRREVPESVFQDLQANVTAFEEALRGRDTGREASVMAGASIDAALERATEALRQLDPIIRNKLRDDPATLAAWESARHTERSPRRSKPNPPPTS
jgi:hypothetical protein